MLAQKAMMETFLENQSCTKNRIPNREFFLVNDPLGKGFSKHSLGRRLFQVALLDLTPATQLTVTPGKMAFTGHHL